MSVTTPETGDLLYSDVEDDLRASVRALVEKQAPWDAVLRRTDTGRDDPPGQVDADLWKRLTQEIGVAGLAVPEERGGAGASWREAAVVAEELGRAVAPVPFLGTAVATALLLGTGEDDLLAAVAAGERTAVLVVGATHGAGRPVPVTVERQGAGDLLHGTVTAVVDAVTADVLLVPVSATEIAVVDADGDGVTRTTSESLDMTRRLTDVVLDGAPARVVTADIDRALQVGAAILASEQLGLAERCLADTVAYLRDRHQFGRRLASYQALKHRLADLWVAITQARAVARYAARCAADGAPDLPVAAAVAQAHCSEVALLAAEDGLQLHGGIGFTWEHPAHLFLKRARADALVLGSADHHRTVLAGLVDLPA